MMAEKRLTPSELMGPIIGPGGAWWHERVVALHDKLTVEDQSARVAEDVGRHSAYGRLGR